MSATNVRRQRNTNAAALAIESSPFDRYGTAPLPSLQRGILAQLVRTMEQLDASALAGYAAPAVAGSEATATPPAGGMRLIACSASAVIVRLGLTPTFAGTAAPSHTSKFS
jgi:hypothetical protein